VWQDGQTDILCQFKAVGELTFSSPRALKNKEYLWVLGYEFSYPANLLDHQPESDVPCVRILRL
jgi:hypothetical protein